MPVRIAITGGIAEGKSTVLRYCEEAGYATGSSDVVAREVFLLPNVQASLVELLDLRMPVEPKAVLDAIARRPEHRRAVNKAMHPQILSRMAESPVRIWEVPLLIETCIYGWFDLVWVVTCGPEEQFRRLVNRLGSEESASKLIQSQLTSRAKSAFADLIVRTNREESLVQQYVLAALKAVS